MDRRMFGNQPASTEIVDIQLNPNGQEDAFFQVVGKEFTCGFSVTCGGVTGGEPGWITLSGYGGHTWRIKRAEPKPASPQQELPLT